MVREQDELSVSFLLWEQARKELRASEDRLYALRAGNDDPLAIDVLDAEIAVLRVKTERLLGQAIESLKEQAARLSRKSDPR